MNRSHQGWKKGHHRGDMHDKKACHAKVKLSNKQYKNLEEPNKI